MAIPQPFERRQLRLNLDHPVPVLPLRRLEQLQFEVGSEIREPRRKGFDPHLEAQMQHTWVVTLVPDPHESIPHQLHCLKQIVRMLTRVLDPDHAFDLGELREKISRPPLRVVGHQRHPRQTREDLVVVVNAVQILRNQVSDEWRHTQRDPDPKLLVAWRQLRRCPQVVRQSGHHEGTIPRNFQRVSRHRFQFVHRQRVHLTRPTSDNDNFHPSIEHELDILPVVVQVDRQQVVTERCHRIRVHVTNLIF